jgi:hypothetical protein
VIGYLIDRVPNSGNYNKTKYDMMLVGADGSDFKQISFWSNNVLDDRLKTMPLELKDGSYSLVKIQFLGTPPGKKYHAYSVFMDRGWRKGTPIGAVPEYTNLESASDAADDDDDANAFAPMKVQKTPQPANQNALNRLQQPEAAAPATAT